MLSPRGSKSFGENWPASWWHSTKSNHGRGTLHVWFGESVSPIPLTGLRWDTPLNLPQERPSVIWELPRIWKTFKMMESTGKLYQTFKGEIISTRTLPEYGRGGNIIQFSWDAQIPKPKTLQAKISADQSPSWAWTQNSLTKYWPIKSNNMWKVKY